MLQSLISYLFTSRVAAGTRTQKRLFSSPFPFEPIDGVVLTLYGAILAWDIHHHLPWIDEAQAWLIARDDSVRDMLLRRLHYEGAPPLWHMLLKAAVFLHLPYAGLNWLGGAFGFAGIVVLLRFSPFPRIFRWLLPFTFYLQYQYAVIARPYVLVPVLLFTLAIIYCLPKPRPVLFALVAGLLANINAHTGILSCVFALLYAYEYWRYGRPDTLVRQRILIGGSLFAALCLISVLTAFPAPDAMVVPNATGKVKQGKPFLRRILPPEQMPASAPPLDPSLQEVAQLRETRLRESQNLPPIVEPHTPWQFFRLRLHLVRLFTFDIALFPVAESNLLGFAFLGMLVVWLWSRGHMRFLLPWLITMPIAAYIWIYDHHTGIFAVALMATIWISLGKTAGPRVSVRISALFAAVTLLVVLLQIGWTIHQVRLETNHPYDAGKQTEAILATQYAGKRIAGFSFQTVSLQPYANHNLFFNQDYTYWLWSNANAIDLRRTETLLQHPDVVVIGDLIEGGDTLRNQFGKFPESPKHPYVEMINFWQDHGYHETQRVCGDRYMRAGIDNTLCELIFEPDKASHPKP